MGLDHQWSKQMGLAMPVFRLLACSLSTPTYPQVLGVTMLLLLWLQVQAHAHRISFREWQSFSLIFPQSAEPDLGPHQD